ncbi:Tim17/Tim22/Tim23/Pmp24 family-domain-containing protein [Mycena alexandri]|uniref:Tim17/Tim22/Tim23/Pmp24 family-domain-containing protein n=1 Tax=Mycena alexandri TaxID=1745969 RepID=A0AAD6X1R3_9AGAR|nr:Tim17/Tim22/Tim23/Pmp24 family-domain-containing protein [Mycena alexandri]
MAKSETQAQSDASSSSNPTDYLRSATFSRSETSPSFDNVATASELLMGAYDPAKLHPLADLGDKLDYLLLEDDKTSDLPGAHTAIPSRGWSDDLCYGTGTMYLRLAYASPTLSLHPGHPIFSRSYCSLASHAQPFLQGLALGGAWGVREGAARPLAVSNTRLRINSVLNSVTRRGTFIGNSAGILALVYNGVNSSIDAMRGKHDILGSMGAGGITGALYKSTAGVKPALAAATFMSGVAGIWSYVKKNV